MSDSKEQKKTRKGKDKMSAPTRKKNPSASDTNVTKGNVRQGKDDLEEFNDICDDTLIDDDEGRRR